VELLAGALGQLEAESGPSLLAGVGDDDAYDGVVTFMMRLVFPLFAEDRRLLPSDDATYDDAYSVSLFDPDRYPWLEGRASPDPELVVSTAGADPKAIVKWLIDRTGLSAEKAVAALDHVPTPDQRTGLERLLGVEMAKLSLWFVTMDRERSSAFLDDRLVTGDSLVGVAFVEQLEALHLDPAAGRRRTEGSFDQLWNSVRRILGETSDQTDTSDVLAARATAVLQPGRRESRYPPTAVVYLSHA